MLGSEITVFNIHCQFFSVSLLIVALSSSDYFSVRRSDDVEELACIRTLEALENIVKNSNINLMILVILIIEV